MENFYYHWIFLLHNLLYVPSQYVYINRLGMKILIHPSKVEYLTASDCCHSPSVQSPIVGGAHSQLQDPPGT